MKLLTRKQVADRIGVTVRTIDKWRKEGKAPPFFKFNGSIRCREDDLDEWIDEKSSGDAAE